jgi:hypothetical protein
MLIQSRTQIVSAKTIVRLISAMGGATSMVVGQTCSVGHQSPVRINIPENRARKHVFLVAHIHLPKKNRATAGAHRWPPDLLNSGFPEYHR